MFNSPCINEYIGKVVMLIINVDLQSKQSLHNSRQCLLDENRHILSDYLGNVGCGFAWNISTGFKSPFKSPFA